jgi:hypothetical protein
VPTYAVAPRFWRDWDGLTAQEQRAFRVAVKRFVEALRSGKADPALRVYLIDKRRRIWTLSFGADARATFNYGRAATGGAHIIWRRIGDHSIYDAP